MGTNYYLVYNETTDDTCPCCGQSITKQKEIHLGKSSSGWTFALHVYPEKGIHTWADVMYECVYAMKAGGWIKDEYDSEIPYNDFLNIVEERSCHQTFEHQFALANCQSPHIKSVDNYLQRNHAVRGPNNLLRSKIDNVHCIGHGNGTYDYCAGEFS